MRILHRYLALLFIGLFAVGILMIFVPVLIESTYFKKWSVFYISLPIILQGGICFVAGVIIKKIQLIAGDYNEEHESFTFSLLKFPPVRYLIFLGLISLTIYLQFEHTNFIEFFFEMNRWQTAFLLVGLIWGSWYKNFRIAFEINQKLFPKLFKKKLSNSDNSDESFIEWLHSEEPICTLESDKFNRTKLVDRIVDRLKNDLETTKGQAIVGDFGSGKSSLMKLVEFKLKSEGKWIVCHFDSWGRITSASQGQELILTKMIESINHLTSTSSIKSIPKNYINALNGFGVWWNNISALLFVKELDPQEQLKKIDHVLTALGMRLVVIIEDIDRNSDAEKLAQNISPLLDRLGGVKNVQLIFTIGNEKHISSVIHRITNYREDLILNDFSIDKLLQRFWIGCMENIAIEKKIVLEGTIQTGNWPLRDGFYYLIPGCRTICHTVTRPVYEALANYLNNPRKTKFVLRRVCEIWKKDLLGEVNPTELLLMTTLKYQDPGVYDFLLKNKKLFLNLEPSENQKRAQEHWQLISTTILDESSAISLIKYLFKIDLYGGEMPKRNFSLQQSVSTEGYGKKYFTRLISGEIENEKSRDQEVIKQLKVFSKLLSSNSVETITTAMIKNHCCPLILEEKYQEEFLRFKFLLPGELGLLVYAYFAYKLKQTGLEEDQGNYFDLVQYIVSNFPSYIDKLDEEKIIQLIIKLLSPFIKINLNTSNTLLNILRVMEEQKKITKDIFLRIKSILAKELFASFPPSNINGLQKDEFAKFYSIGIFSFGDANEIFYQWLLEIEETSPDIYINLLTDMFFCYHNLKVSIQITFKDLLTPDRAGRLLEMCHGKKDHYKDFIEKWGRSYSEYKRMQLLMMFSFHR